MIAGTLAIFGDCGRMPGYLMRRGTMLLAGKTAALTPTFSQSGTLELTVLKLIMREIKTLLPSARHGAFEGPVRRLAGDLATLGKGEIILPAA
jgi:formylmethanofuran dehydrogenase subunit C